MKLVTFTQNKNIFQCFEEAEGCTKQAKDEICEQKKKYVEEVFYF